jgi:putative thioredoxin
VIDVSEQTFQTDVVERSRQVPVVIDFWAPWCGPCRTLGPTLEKLAKEANGTWVLAKVNVDENQALAQAFRIQGIPAVKAVRDGKIVNEFTGAQPESMVRNWLKQLVPTSGNDLVSAAAELEASDPQAAEQRYRLALGEQPDNPEALFGLGRLLFLHGDDEGPALLREIPTGNPFYNRAQGLLELTELLSTEPDDVATLNTAVEATPHNSEVRWQLAAALTRQQAYEPAIEQLLEIVAVDRRLHNDGARRALLGLFALLGDEHPLTIANRKQLMNILF